MIEQLASPSGVSLVEAVLARWLIALSGREYVLDDFRPHGRSERSSITAPEVGSPGAIDPATQPPPSVEEHAASKETHEDQEDHEDHGGADVPGLEVDDRFPGLARFGRLLE